MIVQVAWLPPRGGEMEPTVPMVWHGERLQRLGWGNGIVVIFLEGLSRLPNNYRHRLIELGYRLVDAEVHAQEARKQHPSLAHMPLTNQYWFLRWNVIHRLIAEGVLSLPILHMDGDIVLMTPPATLEADVQAKTFILQGSPAFTAITDPEWFTDWEKGLRQFHDHPKEVYELGREMQRSPRRADRTCCNERAYSTERMWHDQDLMEVMIAAGTLRQASTEEVYRSRYYWMHNPLYPGDWAAEQGAPSASGVTQKGPHTFVAEKAVPFHHFQGDVLRYCRWWLAFRSVGLQAMAAGTHPRHTYPLLNSIAGKWERVSRISRRHIYEQVFAGEVESGEARLLPRILNEIWNLTKSLPKPAVK